MLKNFSYTWWKNREKYIYFIFFKAKSLSPEQSLFQSISMFLFLLH